MNKTSLKVFFLLIVFTFCNTFLLSQQKSKTEANADLVEYTTKEGLPSTNYSNIAQTKDGYIWISGVEGTYRFDGYDFEEVGADIGLPKMQDFYYDSTQNVMYFASPKKFITFNGKEFKVYAEKEGYKLNGLPGQVISFINADSKGRIWIGSETPFVDKKFNGGLTKFENGTFTVYDSTNYPLDNATNFIESPYGDLIFNSGGHNTQTREGSYIALFKNDVFTKIDESKGIHLQGANMFGKDFVTSVDEDGNLWIACFGGNLLTGTSKAGVLMYDGKNFHEYTDFLKYLKNNEFPLEVYYNKKMNKLFLTTFNNEGGALNSKNNAVFEFQNGKWVPSEILKSIGTIKNLKTGSPITDFKYASIAMMKGTKYFPELLVLSGTAQAQSSKYPDQIFSLNDGKLQKFDAFNAGFYQSLDDGALLGSQKGFAIYYPNKSKMLTVKDGLLQIQSNIPNFYTDRNGVVWLSYSYSDLPAYAKTTASGINVWDGKNLRSLTEKDGLAGNITFNVFQDSKKRIWISTSKGATMVREITNSDGEFLFKLNNIKTTGGNPYNVSNVLETKNGEIYAWEGYVRPADNDVVKADYFLGKYNGENFEVIKSPFSESDNSKKYKLYDFKVDNKGRLWFIGIFANNKKDITSAKSNVMIYDGKSWSEPPKEWEIPGDQLHYVGKLDNGMYFLTVGGFYVFNGNEFVNLSDSVNENADFRILKGASVAGTKTDIQAGDRLYIRLRNRGLVIYDGTNLKFFTKKDGLPSTNLSNPISDDYRGIVYFSSPVGALMIKGDKFQSYYDDESIVTGGPYISAMDGSGNMVEYYNGVGLYINKTETRSYPLKISSVTVAGQPSFYQFPDKLSYSQNSFIFNYAAFNFKDPDLTTYEHFLEGYDKDWSRPSDLAFAEYQNIPAGDYTFRVRGVTSNGVKTNEASYSFIVSPPFWRTWWAYTLYVIFIALGLVGIRKYEKGKIVKQEQEKLKEERAAAALKEANLRAQIAEADNKRKSLELEEARNLQLSMLPKELPKLPHIDIAVYMQTATEVGGDYYDFHVHPDGTLTVILGDATGHGMMSGMMVSIMKSLFMSDRTNKELKPFFENSSMSIKDMQLGRLMMALTCVQISVDRAITANAGMPPLYIYRSGQQKIEEININNMPLGAIKTINYDVSEIKVDKGDTLLMMSDGFAELKNKNEEIYGYRRARNNFEKVANKNPDEIISYLRDKGKEWTDNADPDDDVTFVVIKMK
ncbi:MAG TPA: SpoIIE family protein phosphatase [Ignavibacteriaceae bacterium]|nr:SpoIIE family protein phosphatase [Ignavibacteriaceae bacterium]